MKCWPKGKKFRAILQSNIDSFSSMNRGSFCSSHYHFNSIVYVSSAKSVLFLGIPDNIHCKKNKQMALIIIFSTVIQVTRVLKKMVEIRVNWQRLKSLSLCPTSLKFQKMINQILLLWCSGNHIVFKLKLLMYNQWYVLTQRMHKFPALQATKLTWYDWMSTRLASVPYTIYGPLNFLFCWNLRFLD